jgi:hypothetical protein
MMEKKKTRNTQEFSKRALTVKIERHYFTK